MRETISILCKYKNVERIAGAVYIGYIHFSILIPTKLSVSSLMEYLKVKNT